MAPKTKTVTRQEKTLLDYELGGRTIDLFPLESNIITDFCKKPKEFS